MTYIFYHIELVWQFVRGNKEALYAVDASRRGLWLSFLAIAIVEPIRILYAVFFGFQDKLFLFRDGGFGYFLLQLFLDWGLFPLAMLLLAGILAFKDRLIPLIVSSNWLSVIVMVITLVPGAMISSGLASGPVAQLISLAMYGFVLWISFRLFRFVLDCSASIAAGLTIVTVILNIASAALLHQLSTSLTVEAAISLPNGEG